MMKVNERTCKRCGKDVPRGGYTVPRAEIENADTVLDPNEQSVLFCDDCYHVVIYKGQPTADEWAEQTDAIAYPPEKENK
jgi:DNA-directed RNA polymerase subunit RPC12/RpoP